MSRQSVSRRASGLGSFLFVLALLVFLALPVGAQQQIRVMLNENYFPGSVPQDVGEPLTAFEDVAQDWEAMHPGYDIVFELFPEVGTGGLEEQAIRTMLIGGTAPHVVTMNTEIAWPDADKGWWYSFDEWASRPNPYVEGDEEQWDLFANVDMTKGKRGPDGKLYTVPLDIVETGIYYNVDMFEDAGVSVPQTWAEFIELQKKLKSQGTTPIIVNDWRAEDWAHDIIFDQYFYELRRELKTTESETQYLQDYLQPIDLVRGIYTGYLSTENPRYRAVWETLSEWRQYWQNDLLMDDFTAAQTFLTGRAAMIWDGSWLARRMEFFPRRRFGYSVFYLPSITKETSPFAVGAESAVIGGAGSLQVHVTETAMRDGTLDQVLDFVSYISAPENAARIVNESGTNIPNADGAPMVPHMKPFADIVKHRYTMSKWVYSLGPEFNDAFRRGTELFLQGGLTLDEWMDQLNDIQQKAVTYHLNEYGWDISGWEKGYGIGR